MSRLSCSLETRLPVEVKIDMTITHRSPEEGNTTIVEFQSEVGHKMHYGKSYIYDHEEFGEAISKHLSIFYKQLMRVMVDSLPPLILNMDTLSESKIVRFPISDVLS